MSRLVIDLKRDDDIMVPAPWPIGLEDGVVTSGLGHDDGAVLIGFAKKDEQSLAYMPEQIDTISDGKGFFNWNIPVRGIRKIEVAS